jgi:BirA family biotin operon repressor/biotin-[acetyl-CoA-carboxylase] ligase
LYKIPANTLFVGKNLVYVPVCHSTNTVAAELSNKTQLAEGTVVITDHQQAGRGQRGNGWEAEPYLNFTLSLVLKPTFLAIADQFLITQCVSLAVADFINHLITKPVKIKWPNDVFVNDQKVCGILIENSVSGNYLQQSIIGIGLNVNQQRFQNARATSLSSIEKKAFELPPLLDPLLEHLEARYLQLKRLEVIAIQTDYLEQLYRIHERHFYRDSEKEFEGTITGVDNVGRLKIKADRERVFYHKEVIFID